MREDSQPKTVRAALAVGSGFLRRSDVPDPVRDARLLMAAALGIGSDRIGLMLDEEIPPDADRTFCRHIAARSQRRPVSRILGERLFWGRSFAVTPDVLDPRPETEGLIALALEQRFETVLDLGTGSGCIALTLLAERPEANAIATDISPQALRTARVNAIRLGVQDRVHFERSDWFEAVGGTFDLIVSNPPYIDPRERLDLAPEVARCDPKIALFDTGDGLNAYRSIAARAPERLVPGGRLLVEIGWKQGPAVSDLFRAAGLDSVTLHPDLDGRDRVVSAISG